MPAEEVVLDASVVLKWFRTKGERHAEQAQVLREMFEGGELSVSAPTLLGLEIVNVAGRQWRWDEAALDSLVASLEELGFEVIDPNLSDVARWVATGLTAYDATYVALAETAGVKLITDDNLIVKLAPSVAEALEVARQD